MKTLLITALSAMAIALSAAGKSHGQDAMTITVYKTPWCGCCQIWVEAMQSSGYDVKVHDMEDLTQIKKQAGVSNELEACHTAVLDTGRKYVLEGHVPIEAVEKLTSERPDIRGIATPGMPSGSLGMGNDPNARYDVLAFTGNAAEKPTVFYEAGKR
ncbi:DUF411 domain-containing protein [Oricola sp.]|uniref:DUF411 domain-containing protein n=1 Tax=Oricola sp. TaxID=1979950 RepID=UPI00320BF7D9|nr:DUF411 domain-containing protein [Oricola sp.]